MIIKIDPTRLAAVVQEKRRGMKLSFSQLLYGLTKEAWITPEEANDWLVNRTLPAAVEALISTLPVEEQILARARAVQPSEVVRTDPMVEALGAAQGKTPEEMDAFFSTYAQV